MRYKEASKKGLLKVPFCVVVVFKFQKKVKNPHTNVYGFFGFHVQNRCRYLK